ncbi:hypothetical protein EG328_002100 [Venturia inaequalis]|uniref:Uncharacterized protein n=1 Tax=Venturia inaequalis TaxID=5025 RepID=A0A8H3UXB3_VENIN|nr:hypothetical protein EG328_002100 [Venturia inaequalis]
MPETSPPDFEKGDEVGHVYTIPASENGPEMRTKGTAKVVEVRKGPQATWEYKLEGDNVNKEEWLVALIWGL